MPKITFIRNIDDEIIYPKTNMDAILTDDGKTLSYKFKQLISVIDNKAESDHVHSYNDLLDKPTSLIANGGNSDTVCNKTVDDTTISIDNLWTSNETNKVINKKYNDLMNEIDKIDKKHNDLINKVGPSLIAIKETEPSDALIWINPVTNVLKYKYSNTWHNLTYDIKFIEE